MSGLVLTQPIYTFLYNEGLTKTEALSLFDVLQITGIVIVFFLVNRLYVRVDVQEQRMQALHQELSIRLSVSSTPKKINKR
ncbi:hypothetical protein KDA11_02130 [Candidatus Saccharibacteria bacterium]|nr:hypothetical protein [Candidatus Saccharibacteria bacterium]